MRLHDLFDYHAREEGEREFAVQEGRSVTYAEANAQCNRIARALVSEGLEIGDRVAILAKNCIEYAIFYYAASKAGVVPVPLNYRLAPPEWEYIINDSGAKLLIAQDEYREAIDGVRPNLTSVRTLVALAEAPPDPWHAFAGWMDQQPSTPPDRWVDESCDLYQMYTSGTTGRPKGAVLTHRAVTGQLAQLAYPFRAALGERYLIVAPLYHAAAAVTTFNTVNWAGSLYIQSDLNPFEAVRALSEEQIAGALLVPAMIQACLVMVPDVRERSYETLKFIVYGASPIAEQTLRDAIEVFRCDFAQGYGMTETTAVLTYLLPDDHKRAMAGESHLLLSAGRPVAGTEVRIVDEDDEPVSTGEVGEIIGRGPQLMRGYWNLAEASDTALRGGWMHTGDAGRLDEEGYLYIQDRVKDMIVSGGENIYPREIEEVLYRHEAIAEAAVIGIPDPQFGEAVLAFVVLRQGAQASAEQIIEHCRKHLAGYKRPRAVEFIDALPRNPSGKVLKKDLREPYWKGQARRVS